MPHASIRLTVPLFVAALALGSGSARAHDATGELPHDTRILIQTTSGEFIDARMNVAGPDSILVQKGKRSIAIPVKDVRGVWTWRRDATGGLKAGAIYGAAVGLAYGLTVPTDCVDCGDERGSSGTVMSATLVNAGFFGLIGMLIGYWDGAWEARPGWSGTPTTTTGGPFPLWSMSGSVGGTYQNYAGETNTSFAIAGYRNSRPGSSMGFEYGVLELAKREPYSYTYRPPPRYSPPWDSTAAPASGPLTVQGEEESAWHYMTLFIGRARGTKGIVRAHFLGGPAVYTRSSAYSSTTRDSTGAVVSTLHGSSMASSLGVMAGFGTTVGQGSLLPALRARAHWIFNDPETFALTVEAGVDFH